MMGVATWCPEQHLTTHAPPPSMAGQSTWRTWCLATSSGVLAVCWAPGYVWGQDLGMMLRSLWVKGEEDADPVHGLVFQTGAASTVVSMLMVPFCEPINAQNFMTLCSIHSKNAGWL
eukprot:1160336-Pelagomonas_calceolata.AAC.8